MHKHEILQPPQKKKKIKIKMKKKKKKKAMSFKKTKQNYALQHFVLLLNVAARCS
jgi:hypothetical protein